MYSTTFQSVIGSGLEDLRVTALSFGLSSLTETLTLSSLVTRRDERTAATISRWMSSYLHQRLVLALHVDLHAASPDQAELVIWVADEYEVLEVRELFVLGQSVQKARAQVFLVVHVDLLRRLHLAGPREDAEPW